MESIAKEIVSRLSAFAEKLTDPKFVEFITAKREGTRTMDGYKVTSLRRVLPAIIAALLLTAAGYAAEPQGVITAVVERCIDGDTLIVVDSDGEDIAVRLWGCDAPESERKGWWGPQPYNAVAREMLAAKCLNKQVALTRKGQSYGRLVAQVRVVESDVDLSYEMVREGLAWWAKPYAPKDKTFGELEEAAKRERRGLWSEKEPIEPVKWRKR